MHVGVDLQLELLTDRFIARLRGLPDSISDELRAALLNTKKFYLLDGNDR